MDSFKARAVSVAMIIALSGTPGFAAACAALCMPAMDHASQIAAASDHHATHGSPSSTTDGAAADSGHHHAAAQENGLSGTRSPGDRDEAAASDRSCCTNDDAKVAASVAPVRPYTGAGLQGVSSVATPFDSRLALCHEPNCSPPIQPPSPPRSPLVLRV